MRSLSAQVNTLQQNIYSEADIRELFLYPLGVSRNSTLMTSFHQMQSMTRELSSIENSTKHH